MLGIRFYEVRSVVKANRLRYFVNRKGGVFKHILYCAILDFGSNRNHRKQNKNCCIESPVDNFRIDNIRFGLAFCNCSNGYV